MKIWTHLKNQDGQKLSGFSTSVHGKCTDLNILFYSSFPAVHRKCCIDLNIFMNALMNEMLSYEMLNFSNGLHDYVDYMIDFVKSFIYVHKFDMIWFVTLKTEANIGFH